MSNNRNNNNNNRQTRDQYVKVRNQESPSEEHEIRVRAGFTEKNYVNRAATLLLRDQVKLEEGQTAQPALNRIVFNAVGPAIPTALNAAFIIRSKIPGLYQINRIKTIEVKDTFRAKTAGLPDREQERQLSVFEIELTREQPKNTEAGNMGLLEQQPTGAKLEDIVRQGRGRKQQQGVRQQNRNNNRRGDRRNNNNNNGDRRNNNNGDRRNDNRDNNRRNNNRDNNRGYNNRNNDRRPNQRRNNNNNRKQSNDQ